MVARPLVIVMAKVPVMGLVKTRLARDIGAVAATGFYRANLCRLLRGLRAAPWFDTLLAIAPDHAAQESPPWAHGLAMVGQGRGDLGQRMARLLSASYPGPVLLTGSDIPDLTPRHLRQAFSALRRPGVVFGPAQDGGYWCIGRGAGTALPHNWLRGLPWSRSDTLAASLRATPGRRTVLPVVLGDIDTGADWQQWRRKKGRPE